MGNKQTTKRISALEAHTHYNKFGERYSTSWMDTLEQKILQNKDHDIETTRLFEMNCDVVQFHNDMNPWTSFGADEDLKQIQADCGGHPVDVKCVREKAVAKGGRTREQMTENLVNCATNVLRFRRCDAEGKPLLNDDGRVRIGTPLMQMIYDNANSDAKWVKYADDTTACTDYWTPDKVGNAVQFFWGLSPLGNCDLKAEQIHWTRTNSEEKCNKYAPHAQWERNAWSRSTIWGACNIGDTSESKEKCEAFGGTFTVDDDASKFIKYFFNRGYTLSETMGTSPIDTMIRTSANALMQEKQTDSSRNLLETF